MNPSAFQIFPWSSIFGNSESEIIALNIIHILSRTGDTWRTLTWDEYKEERLKDAGKPSAGFSERERGYFDAVLPYTVSESAARTFCKIWEQAAGAQNAE